MSYIVKIQDGIVKYLPADDLSVDFTVGGILNVDTQINIGNSQSPTSTITSPGDILLDATNTGVVRVEPTSRNISLNGVYWPDTSSGPVPGMYIGASSLNTLEYQRFIIGSVFSDNETETQLNSLFPNVHPGQSVYGPSVLYTYIDSGNWRISGYGQLVAGNVSSDTLTPAELDSLFPNIAVGQYVVGPTVLYLFVGDGWRIVGITEDYFQSKVAEISGYVGAAAQSATESAQSAADALSSANSAAASAQEAQTTLSTKVSKSGDTMTGALSVPAGASGTQVMQAQEVSTLVFTRVGKTGDTMTGNLTVPSINTGQLAGFRNKIINGKMEIAQRGTSFPAVANAAYMLDRWGFGNTSTAVATSTQQSDVPSNNEFQNSLRVAITTADTSIAVGDLMHVWQRVEGYNARDLIGRTFALSFWVRSSKTGTHCVALRNSGIDRSYVAEYNISAANTWEFKTITVPGGLINTGTWNWTTGNGLDVGWALAAGSNYQTTPDEWRTGNFLATANQVNVLDTVGNIFAITGVQLEVGPNATPYEHRHCGIELSLCQRYYEKSSTSSLISWSGATTSGITYYTSVRFSVTKRASPTVTTTTIEQTNFPATGSTVNAYDVAGFRLQRTSNATGTFGCFADSWTASSEL